MTTLRCPSQAELDQMSHAEKDALIMRLFDLLEGLEKRLGEVERKVKKTSRNSNQPPSSDGLRRQAAEPRKRGDKPSGGQPGQVGVPRAWTDTPDYLQAVRSDCECGLGLAGQPERVGECRRQIEIAEPKVEGTEYHQMIVERARGREHRGVFPPCVTPHVSYGPRLKAYAVGLVDGHFVSASRTAEIIADQYGLQPGGSIQRWIGQAAAVLTPTYEASGRAIAAAEVAHFDESGVRVNGHTHWLHVAGTAEHAFYTIHPLRGREAMEAAGLLPKFAGYMVHDPWAPYFSYEQSTHALCDAHILREPRYFEEATGGHQWPIQPREILVDGKKAVEAAGAAGQSAVDPVRVADILARNDQWVGLGLFVFPECAKVTWQRGRPKQHSATNLIRRMRDFKSEIFRFLHDFRVPFDNNLAERLVRPVEVKLKVAGRLGRFSSLPHSPFRLGDQ